MIWDLFLKGILIPGGISGAAILILHLFRVRREMAIPIATGIGYLGAHQAIMGFPQFPPLESTQWIFIFTILALGIGIYAASTGRRAGSIPMGAISLALPALMAIPLFKYTWSPNKGAGIVLSLAIFIFILWWLMERVLEEGALPYMATLLIMNSAGGIALILSGSIILGQMAGAFSAALLPPGILLLTDRDRIFLHGLPPIAVTVMGGLWVGGYLFSDLSLWSILLLGFAIFAPMICKIRYLKGETPWKKAIISGLMATIPSALALGMASL